MAHTSVYVFNFLASIITSQHTRLSQMIEAHLENVREGEDADKLCASTPLDIYGRHILNPDSCGLHVSPVVMILLICDNRSCASRASICLATGALTILAAKATAETSAYCGTFLGP